MPDHAGFVDLGLKPYKEVHALQVRLAEALHAGTLSQEQFLCVEHPAVFTMGRNASRAHLGVTGSFLAERSIAVVPIERGGEVTYHGPGQLVLYPILRLKKHQLRVGDYVCLLEELMLRVAADFGVQAARDPRNHGIWVGNNKLGSIGLAIRHGVSFHGLALNVNLDLTPFGWINPCGLTDVQMTSMAVQKAENCTLAAVKQRLVHHIRSLFSLEIREHSESQLFSLLKEPLLP
ncbi:lipoyl(octanoyl) transferase LipB [Desulfobulbus rhabdoformis]|jgi:lipoyl(octanoyl) transferase|uniref:lipoyl(octanoyl) transferase LipB n=1 Tax=Desulfobulbus rhabdoformis TaxID=34032 RepID=UPI001965CAA1|nr:lipoyl(octanoyl) transferase LipB [Desulfobulbus rhabdoformis]MBM9613445.1 lipoyl(octanoyl) transferase LipB [Desulfobulbus rhabdoformis]